MVSARMSTETSSDLRSAGPSHHRSAETRGSGQQSDLARGILVEKGQTTRARRRCRTGCSAGPFSPVRSPPCRRRRSGVARSRFGNRPAGTRSDCDWTDPAR